MNEVADPKNRGGTVWDWANQQVVKQGEGPGIDTPPGSQMPAEADEQPTNLDSMTKAELLDYAAANDVTADESMTKADIRAAIETGG